MLFVWSTTGCSAPPMKPLVFPASVGLQSPLPGHAVVYLIRPPHDGLELAVRTGETLMAVLPKETYTAVNLRPGKHVINATSRPTALQLGGPEAAIPFELTVAANERRFLYIVRPRGTSTSVNLTPVPSGVLPSVGHTSVPSGYRQWKEAAEAEALDLMSIAKVVLPERDAF